MKIRFPLYVKILGWFFLNVLLLVVVFSFVARVQFRFGLDALIAGHAGDRIQEIAKLMTQELRERPGLEWNSVLARFTDVYAVQFFLFRNNGEQMAGNTIDLPPEVREKLIDRRGGGNPAMRRPDGDRRQPFVNPTEFAPPPIDSVRIPRPTDNFAPRMMVHSSNPSRYWVFVRTALVDSEMRRPTPVTLVAMSPNLNGGGLFFDFTPWIVAAIAVILISVAFWFPLVRGITKSISRITHATERMAEGQFDARVEDARRDELGQLGGAINRMASRLSGFVAGQKTFLGDIAHELCSPLARMQMALGIIEQRSEGKPNPYINDLREEVEHMSSLVNELLSFSKASLGKSKIKMQRVVLHFVVQKAAHRESGSVNKADIKINVPEELCALAEPELLLRAVSNILRNAIRYAGEAGPISVTGVFGNGLVTLTIEDCGSGIPEESLEQVFDPFYRIDSSRSRETGGVGLGLSIVKTCIESCGGTVSCENRKPTGLRVVIQLPVAN